MVEKKHFYLKLNPPRPTFIQDMTDAEAKIMREHGAYWKEFQNKGICIVYGPVFDSKGVFGVGILEVEDEAEVGNFVKNDPVIKAGIGSYEVYPMKATTR